ncbi:hypothetical protein PX554_17800 [Sphingomonas sp. H39-1-10]|uniref:hypothetical protein n=1 Tax=Sphingomonas pollutisoli TaxID=3030829 RepID=UPI0023B90431|nr:hypothetical protein [Sphingomonas pollutisoli]MDF0489992.1 hypothetical protein [Sphingomonas pollutisoli]
MKRATRTLALALAIAALPLPVFAQDVGPALDPGAMTGWAGGAAMQHSLRHRGTRRAPPMSTSEASARAKCARRYTVASNLGMDHPATQHLFRLCRAAGYY